MDTFMVKKATENKRTQVERFVVVAAGRVTGVNPDDIHLLHRFEIDLCMGYGERTNLATIVQTEYDVQVDIVQYSEDKTIANLVEEIMASLK
jgi:hypothetical protein